MDALRAANEVRALRAQLKRDLKAGQVSPSKTFGGLSERQRAELAERLHRS